MSDLTPAQQDELGRRLEAEHAREVAKWDDHRCPWRDMAAFQQQVHGWVWCEGVVDGPFRPRPKGHTVCCDRRCNEHENFDCPGPHRPLIVDAISAPDQPFDDPSKAESTDQEGSQ